MSAFDRFNIKHLSASSLNTWRAEPALWCLRYLHGVRDESGASALRGNAVEAGVVAFMHYRDPQAALDAAQQSFEANALGEATPELEEERAAIPDYLKQALHAFHQFGAPLIGTQVKVELWLDDVSVPVIGYADFVFEDEAVHDLKTTSRIPSEPRPDHARQASIYRKARNAPVSGLVYVSAKRWQPYSVADTDHHIAALRRDAMNLERFLSRCESPLDALSSLPINVDGFMWSDAAKAKVAEFFA